MKEIVESYFKQRSLVNHQLASYNDCIPVGDGKGKQDGENRQKHQDRRRRASRR